MDWLSWLRGILVVALFGWLLEALQPASALRRYTRLVIGLLLMVAVLSPVVGLLRTKLPTLTGVFWQDRDVQGLLQQGGVLESREEAQTVQDYRQQMAATAAAAAEAVDGGAAVRVTLVLKGDEPASAVAVVRGGHPSDAARQAVARAVGTTLGISTSEVRVDWT